MSRWGRVCWRVGYVQGVPLPCDLSRDACDVTYLPTRLNDEQTPVKGISVSNSNSNSTLIVCYLDICRCLPLCKL